MGSHPGEHESGVRIQMALSFSQVGARGRFTVRVLSRIRLLLSPIKRLSWKCLITIKRSSIAVARQGAGALLVARGLQCRRAVMVQVLGRVLKPRGRCSGPVNQGMAPSDARGEPAVIVSWFQPLAAFILGVQGVNKVGTHGLVLGTFALGPSAKPWGAFKRATAPKTKPLKKGESSLSLLSACRNCPCLPHVVPFASCCPFAALNPVSFVPG